MSQPDPTPSANPASAPPPLLEITTPAAIALARRWWWISAVVKVSLLPLLIGAVYLYEQGGGIVVIVALFVAWTFVASLSARTRQLAFAAGAHIAAGEFDLAEDRLTQSLKSFSIAGSTKQFGLQQLAMLRHAQSRWADAAALAKAFLSHRKQGDITSHLVLAESLLELGDLNGVARELHALSQQRLNLRETIILTQLRLDLSARQGQFAAMFAQPQATVSLLELMPATLGMQSHAMLALAAKKLNKPDWQRWLIERAKLLGDVEPMFVARPFLREAFEG